jgi:hypothetical protein
MRNHTLKRLAVRGGRAKIARRPQVTLRLPRRLYERAKLLVKEHQTGSVNEFIVKAVAAYLKAIDRKVIDDAFAGMANDEEYRREALRIVEEFGC